MPLLLLLVLLAATPFGAAQKAEVPSGVREIEGREHPELIPDHTVWRSTFHSLASIRKSGGEADIAWVLPLSQEDAARVYAEALKQPQRDAACEARYKARQAALREEKASLSATEQALDELTIDCRTQDLDAADRVLDGLSDEGRQSLMAYIERSRRAITLYVPQRELSTYRLPR